MVPYFGVDSEFRKVVCGNNRFYFTVVDFGGGGGDAAGTFAFRKNLTHRRPLSGHQHFFDEHALFSIFVLDCDVVTMDDVPKFVRFHSRHVGVCVGVGLVSLNSVRTRLLSTSQKSLPRPANQEETAPTCLKRVVTGIRTPTILSRGMVGRHIIAARDPTMYAFHFWLTLGPFI